MHDKLAGIIFLIAFLNQFITKRSVLKIILINNISGYQYGHFTWFKKNAILFFKNILF